MRLLVSHVRLSVRIERPTATEGILMKFDFWMFSTVCREILGLIKMRQE